MNQRFLNVLNEFVLPHECEFAKGHWGDMKYVVAENVPGDRGGVTKYGIDQASHPDLDIANLTQEQAAQIYWDTYWLGSKADLFPRGYGEVLFDIKVNGGNGPKMLQKALRKNDPSIEVDGVLGPKTIKAAELQGEVGLENFLLERQNYYFSIVERNPSQQKFLKGWLNRNNELAEFVGVSLND